MVRSHRFIPYTDKAGEIRWRVRAPNGDIVADSGEGYKRLGGAVKGWNSLVRAIQEGRITTDSAGIEMPTRALTPKAIDTIIEENAAARERYERERDEAISPAKEVGYRSNPDDILAVEAQTQRINEMLGGPVTGMIATASTDEPVTIDDDHPLDLDSDEEEDEDVD